MVPGSESLSRSSLLQSVDLQPQRPSDVGAGFRVWGLGFRAAVSGFKLKDENKSSAEESMEKDMEHEIETSLPGDDWLGGT